jgi:hypothetical protein
VKNRDESSYPSFLRPVVRALDFLASMGLTVRGDPPRQIEVEGREWGEPAGGVSLSIREVPRTDADQLASLSVVMKNGGERVWPIQSPGWMCFYRVETDRPVTAFGQQLLMPQHQVEHVNISLGPGDATETDVPVAQIYDMRRGGAYPVRVACTLPDGAVVRSNQIVIRP